MPRPYAPRPTRAPRPTPPRALLAPLAGVALPLLAVAGVALMLAPMLAHILAALPQAVVLP